MRNWVNLDHDFGLPCVVYTISMRELQVRHLPLLDAAAE